MWVDADGCPKNVVTCCLRLGQLHGAQVITISNFHHVIDHPNHITVSDESQAVDFAILNSLKKGDIVVTQDQGLAALVLAKGGKVLSVSGHIYQAEEITVLLELRNEAARYRRTGGRTKGPSKRTKAEDARFEEALLQVL